MSMLNPIAQTIHSYQKNFDKYARNSPTEVSGGHKKWMDHFVSLLPPKPQIIEFGSATGRDARYFRDQGVDVFCTDVVPEALSALDKDGFKTAYHDFCENGRDKWPFFDGIYANAVLVHCPEKKLLHALQRMNQIIKDPGGLIAVSFKNGCGEKMSNEKIDAPRFFQYYSKEDIRRYMKEALFEVVYLKYAENFKWILCIAKTMI